MNKQIHVRDFDDTTHGRLVDMANAKGLSLSEFIRQELTEIAQKPSNAEFIKLLKELPREKINWTSEDTVRIIHEGREERDQQIHDSLSSSKAAQT